ncbi:DNA-processing protein DprA [Sinomonas sp. G460-2]|uniref:DNA-processing protein DprA n=1 Tax=Sinomonas sp. G460-2 TaxID=3393464 RepID=UPI0039F008F3
MLAGGAYGIEGAAHGATVAVRGDTIAVIAGGVDRPYPNGHREHLEGIADVGLLVSELPPGSTPTRQRFLAR